MIDVIKTEKVDDTIVEGWVPGIVQEINENEIIVETDGQDNKYLLRIISLGNHILKILGNSPLKILELQILIGDYL